MTEKAGIYGVDRPILIVGTGRCGSTMLHRVLALHKELGWLSTFNEVFPTQYWLSYFSNMYRTQLPPKIRHLPFFPKPFEAYRFWEYYLPGFSRRDKPQTADDVPTDKIEPVREAVSEILNHQHRKRFLVKVTGWSRIEYFDKIFPNSRFVFLNREHRSVVSSWVQAGWLDVTSSIESDEWQWGEVPEHYRQVWNGLGGGSLLSAALKIRLDLDDIRKNLYQVPDRCIEIQYEDLIAQPSITLGKIQQFCELDSDEKFEARVRAMEFYNVTDKWKKYLSEEEGDRVLEFFRRTENP